MLDTIMALFGQLHEPTHDDHYKPQSAIKNTTYSELPGSRTLTVVFPPWHLPRRLANRLQKRLLATGSSTLFYTFNPLVLQDDAKGVIASFDHIAKTAAQEVNTLVADKEYTRVHLIGLSLGNVALCVTAQNLKFFHAVIMAMPGDDLAASLWRGSRTQHLRKAFQRQGISLDELKRQWSKLAPVNYVHTFKGHDVQILLARHDTFIPYSNGRTLFEHFERNGQATSLQTYRAGHVGALFRFCLRGR